METKKPTYTVLEKIEGVPQMLKLAPVHPEPEPEAEPRAQHPLADNVRRYPLG